MAIQDDPRAMLNHLASTGCGHDCGLWWFIAKYLNISRRNCRLGRNGFGSVWVQMFVPKRRGHSQSNPLVVSSARTARKSQM